MKHYQIMLILFIAGGSVFLIARLWQKIIDKRKGSNPYSWANLLCLYAGVVALLGGLPLLHMLIINLAEFLFGERAGRYASVVYNATIVAIALYWSCKEMKQLWKDRKKNNSKESKI